MANSREVDHMTMLEVLNILWNLYDECVIQDAFDSVEERVKLRSMLTRLRPEHRDTVIAMRDKALDDSNMEWAVELSHVIAAMSDSTLWVDDDVPF